MFIEEESSQEVGRAGEPSEQGASFNRSNFSFTRVLQLGSGKNCTTIKVGLMLLHCVPKSGQYGHFDVMCILTTQELGVMCGFLLSFFKT